MRRLKSFHNGMPTPAAFFWVSMILMAVTTMPAIGFAAAVGVNCRVDIDREVLPADSVQRAVIKVTLDAPPPPERTLRPAVNLSIVLDRSGSMTGQKLKKAKEAAIEALQRMDGRDVFSLVVYDHNVQTIVPAQSASNTEWIEGRIRAIRSGGNTALFAGISQAAAEVRKHQDSRFVHRIVLLSDGLANVGPSSPGDLGRLGAALLKENISVTTVGVGTDYNEDLMTRLAQNSDGNSYFVESGRDLPRIFAAELGDVLSVVAKRVDLLIECPQGVRPLRIIGREGRIKGRQVELYLNQLYGGQDKYALVEVEVSGGASGEIRPIAVARVFYDNPFSRQRESASADVSARFSDDLQKIRQSVNVNVNRAYQLNLNALSQDHAISLSDEGKKEAAVQTLRTSAGRLQKAGQALGDEALLEKAAEMEGQADQIESHGMTKRNRKLLRTESYQMKQQQKAK